MKIFQPYVPLTLVTPEGRFVIVDGKQIPIEEFDMKAYFEEELRRFKEKSK